MWWVLCNATFLHSFVVCLQAEASRSLSRHRKIASSFRDTQLFEIFQLGCGLLRKAQEMMKTIDFNDADQVEYHLTLSSLSLPLSSSSSTSCELLSQFSTRSG